MGTILRAKKGKNNLSTANGLYNTDYHNQVKSLSIIFNVGIIYK